MVALSALDNAVPMGDPQYEAFLNTSASLNAPERQHNLLNTLLYTFFANQGGITCTWIAYHPRKLLMR